MRRNAAAPRSDFVSTPTNPSRLKNRYRSTATASMAANWSRFANSRLSTMPIIGSHHDGWFSTTSSGSSVAGNAAPDFDSRTAWKCLRT